jgi:glucan biosynthesis protein C
MSTPTTRRFAGLRTGRLRRLITEPLVTPPKSEPRLPGLDALRSASMVAVVAAHAAYAYVACRLAGLPWAVSDPKRSFAFDVICWSSISWAMPAFFTLGGFAAAAIWSSKGPRGFAVDRLRRIVAPALVALPTVLLPSLAVWTCGWFVSGRTDLTQIAGLNFVDLELLDNQFGPAHLWFLEYLILMLGGYGIVRLVTAGAGRRLPAFAFSWMGPFALAIPTTLILWLGHAANGLDPIMDMRNSFLPNPLRLLHHAWFFAVGTWMFAARDQLPRLKRLAPAFLALAVPIFAIRAILMRDDAETSLRGFSAWASVGSAALFGWLSLLSLIGLSLRIFTRSTATIRYLADSSYWIYLTHFPVVGLAQVGLYPLPWPAWVKFAISLSATLALGLLSYHGLVRYWAIGRRLHGIRSRRIAARQG